MNGTPNPLEAWQSFYVIVGSSAGALTGLQFVVLTLITEAGMLRGSGDALSAFASPNIVHFCLALLVSALFSAPWGGLGPPGIAVALVGAGGFVYSVLVLGVALRQRDYKPVLEDWIWHAVLPMLAYAALVHSGLVLRRGSVDTLYVVGTAALLLIFIGIHNAWDTVTFVTLQRAQEVRRKAAAEAAASAPPPASPPAR
jgi:hypothetical protein